MSKIQRLREQLYLLQGSRCFYCDQAISLEERTLEHIVPCKEGGLADAENGVVVCAAANQLLGCVTPKQKMMMLKAGNGTIECPKKCFEHHPCIDEHRSVSVNVAIDSPAPRKDKDKNKFRPQRNNGARGRH